MCHLFAGRKGKKGKTPAAKSALRRRSDSDNPDVSEDEDFHPAQRGRKAKPKLSFSSDEEEGNEDLFDATQVKSELNSTLVVSMKICI